MQFPHMTFSLNIDNTFCKIIKLIKKTSMEISYIKL